jgi:myosin heavy subunit
MVHVLHEAPLLYMLQRRLRDGRIYTWAGDVLLSLNPYSYIPVRP